MMLMMMKMMMTMMMMMMMMIAGAFVADIPVSGDVLKISKKKGISNKLELMTPSPSG